jgi:hypothetical protein
LAAVAVKAKASAIASFDDMTGLLFRVRVTRGHAIMLFGFVSV